MAFLVATLALAALVPNVAVAQATPDPNFTPLASKKFDWNALPYQADTGTGERGTQQGYNICNSTVSFSLSDPTLYLASFICFIDRGPEFSLPDRRYQQY
jgi:hypothetical protein